jgi:hypothetical protein
MVEVATSGPADVSAVREEDFIGQAASGAYN